VRGVLLLRDGFAERVLQRMQFVERWRRENGTLAVRDLVLEIEVQLLGLCEQC
jgi:hypothetical protein